MTKEEKKKQPTITTLEHKGTKVDLIDFGDGRQALFYQIEKFRGLGIGAFRIGWTNKYAVVSPEQLTRGTLDLMATSGSIVTGSTIKPEDFEPMVIASEKIGIGAKGTAEVKELKPKASNAKT
jgi:hypothetical protein